MSASQKDEEQAVAAFAAILDSCRVPQIELERVSRFIRASGLTALLDFSTEDAMRSALGISRSTARVLYSVRRILEEAGKDRETGEGLTREQVADDLRLLDHEEMRGLYFGDVGAIVHAQTLSIGEHAEVNMDAFACFRPAFVLRAKRIELMHNHPSGDSSPSVEDISSCCVLARTARELGIDVSVLWIVTKDSLTKHLIP